MTLVRAVVWTLSLCALAALPGCGSRRPPPAAPLVTTGADGTPVIDQSLYGMGRSELRAAFQDCLMRALKPKVKSVDQVTGNQYRYRKSGLLGRSTTVTVYIQRIGAVELVKDRRWVHVLERSANPNRKGKPVDRVLFQTEAEAMRYRDLVMYAMSQEFQTIVQQEQDAAAAALAASRAPRPAAPPPVLAPCVVCGEPRGDATPCPACGTD